MRHRAVLLLAAMAVGLLVASDVALAANPTNCADNTVASCDGTTEDDEMTGTSGTDHMYAKVGKDTLRGLERFDDDCADGADRVVTADPKLDSQSLDCIDFVDPGP